MYDESTVHMYDKVIAVLMRVLSNTVHKRS